MQVVKNYLPEIRTPGEWLRISGLLPPERMICYETVACPDYSVRCHPGPGA
jgi:hypothetical protein